MSLRAWVQRLAARRHGGVIIVAVTFAFAPVGALPATTESPAGDPTDALRIFADARIRYEHTTAQPSSLPDRDRGSLRARLGAEFRHSERLYAGLRLVTGDPDDPKSSDVTFGDYSDDFEVSVDRAYLAWRSDNLFLTLGKFENPLVRSHLVWDGDVNPSGVAAKYEVDLGGARGAVTALHAVLDEQSSGPDSNLNGVQMGFDRSFGSGSLGPGWRGEIAIGYYDYGIGSLENADAGDIRENRLTADAQAYLSDYDLVDVVARFGNDGADLAWPIEWTGNFVRNLDAEGSQDSGLLTSVSLGRISEPGDWRIGYEYLRAETDAVFAAYSHDNLTYGTNYEQHGFVVERVLPQRVTLNLTVYRYRRLEVAPTLDVDPVTRVRLSVNWAL